MNARVGMVMVVLTTWLLAGAGTARAETHIWRKTPITVELIVGVEQMLTLPADGAVGLPPRLANANVFRTLATGGAVYWMALEPFDNERIQVRLQTGEYLLFDVTARTVKAPPAKVSPLSIVMEGENAQAPPGELQVPTTATIFELIRYAAQSIYSPRRLVAPVPGVTGVPVGLSGNFNQLYEQGDLSGLVIQPLQAWSSGELYVTTFVVTNEHSEPVTLDNRKVRHSPYAHRTGVDPHFIASAFYDSELPARSAGNNRTILFVVTDRPIRSVIRGI